MKDQIAMLRVFSMLNNSQIFKTCNFRILIKIIMLVDMNTCVLFVLCTFMYLPERAVTQIPYAFKTSLDKNDIYLSLEHTN